MKKAEEDILINLFAKFKNSELHQAKALIEKEIYLSEQAIKEGHEKRV
jgi:hypothetical protein